MNHGLTFAAPTMLELTHRRFQPIRWIQGVRNPRRDQREEQAAKLLRRMKAIPDVRLALVRRVRSEISTDGYESPAKIDAAVHSLADDLAAGL